MNVGDVLQGRYRIVRLVGQGGFGAVYRAWDMNLKVPVALKENADTGPEAQRQFEREAHLLANLRHANLPRVSDHFGVPGQGQYLVMDFVEGKSLAALLAERGGPLSEVAVLPWIRQVCDALEYLHSRIPPVIHRDIKPDNIIIGPDGRAMLVDFGISKEFAPGKGTTARAPAPGAIGTCRMETSPVDVNHRPVTKSLISAELQRRPASVASRRNALTPSPPKL